VVLPVTGFAGRSVPAGTAIYAAAFVALTYAVLRLKR
jgi:hypothetical protein